MSPLARECIETGVVVAVSIILAWGVRRIISVFARRMYRAKAKIGGDLLRGIRTPIVALILLIGTFAAMGRLSILRPIARDYDRVFQAVGILIVLFGLSNIANLFVRWFSKSFGSEYHSSHMSILKKLVVMTVWILGSIQILSIFGMKLTTVLASLGLAGLAVGLALQDTIANVFAGFYLVADRSVSSGDYIKLETGEEGFVESVGWRNTRIRLWANNIVLIPNGKLTQSVITNMALPEPMLSVYTSCGVSYDSDLDRVESVALEVAREVLNAWPGGDLSFDPVLRYKEFGESNIKFVVVFRAIEVGAQYLLQHEYIKALHSRFRELNIEISYPVRKLVWDGSSAPISTVKGE